MKTLFKSLFALTLAIVMFSSCKKTTDLSILTGHKWTLTSATDTYSDSVGVSHNLLQTNANCTGSTYTQYENNATNSALKLAYTYTTYTTCLGYYTLPSVGVSSWNIDPNNTVLYLNGNLSDGTGGTWYTIQSISSSSLVLVQINNALSGAGANIYHTITTTATYTGS